MLAPATPLRRVPLLAAGLLVCHWAGAHPQSLGADQAPGVLRTIHLAAGQIVCRPGDIDGNLQQICQLAKQAAAAGARLCLFAEGAITGYVTTPSVLAAAPTADGAVAARLQKAAAELNVTIAAGTLERVDRGTHVSCSPGHCSIIDSRGRMVALQPGEYVIDYLEPRMIHGPVIVQAPRTATAQSGPVTLQPAAKVLRVLRTDDFAVTGRGDSAAWEKACWEPLQLRSVDSQPHNSQQPVRRDSALTPARCGSTASVAALPPYATRIKVLSSATGLYVLMEATDRAITATMKEDFLDLWKEDVFEFFLWPDERYPLYFEYEISPLGFELPILIPNLDGKFLGWRPWHYEGPRKTRKATTVVRTPGAAGTEVSGWKAEVFVPYELLTPLGNVPPTPGTRWRANFYRVDHDSGQPVSWDWSRVGRSFHEFRKYGTLVFD